MAIQEIGRLDAAFLISEANAYRSRDEATVDATAGAIEGGVVLGRVTASGDLVAHAPGASDGSENAAAILLLKADATAASRTVIARDAEVDGKQLTYATGITPAQTTAANAALAALGIVVR